MQDQVVKPIFLSVNQLTELFNNPQQETSILDDHNNLLFLTQDSFVDFPLEFSFQALHMMNSQKTIKDNKNNEKPINNVLVSKDVYQQIMSKMEHNRNLSEKYQQMMRENQEQIQKRKKLEDQNAAIMDQNFQIKREIQEMKQKLQICQSAIPLRKDQQIIELRNQSKELQAKLAEKRDTQQSAVLTENSTVGSKKSNSYYCNTNRLVKLDQRSSQPQSKKPYRSRNNSFVKIVQN
ncbi:unnamed protein product (macronuclear) [Paramecium tetraurelia]|uniref:Uncharacterized protein n=1 Tax=Paramecium tetraurelia TaxID=5888 RepID=A0DLS8_PARTE|nr:uncharacterized protein GSPATT00039627001 [Paramecium tetraurelia]CAK83995.1 unnamed protein product [Paramecium tetraurelia]|eukprot:XP_001451392.1 hypothetical protein (macronuclear) [Paramecium tetraurelia strain d4-2]